MLDIQCKDLLFAKWSLTIVDNGHHCTLLVQVFFTCGTNLQDLLS